MSLAASFNRILERYGRDVTVITVDGETEVIRCRLTLAKGTEKGIEAGIMSAGDAIGRFKLSDYEYISERNEINYFDEDGNFSVFRMLKPVRKMTHYEAICERKE